MKNSRDLLVFAHGFEHQTNHYPIKKIETAIKFVYGWSICPRYAKIVEFYDIGEGIKMGVTIVEGRWDDKLYRTQ